MKKKNTVYLGYDGSYVMCSLPLVVKSGAGGPYLTYEGRRKYQCVDMGREGHIVFGHLKLKKFDVVKITIAAGKTKRARRVRT